MDCIDLIIKESKKNLESSPIKNIGELKCPSNDNEPLMIMSIGEGNKLFLYRSLLKSSFIGDEYCYKILKNNEELVKVFNDYSTARKFMIGQERR